MQKFSWLYVSFFTFKNLIDVFESNKYKIHQNATLFYSSNIFRGSKYYTVVYIKSYFVINSINF